MFLAHPASGLTIAYATRKLWDKKDFSTKEKAYLFSSAIITASLPDFDLIYSLLTASEHRSYITHTPCIYIIASLAIFLTSFLVQNMARRRFIRSLAFIFLLGTMLHMVTDTFASSIMVLYPFSRIEIVTLKLNPILQEDKLILQFLSTPLLLGIEIFFLVSALFILFLKLKRDKKIFAYSSLTLALLSIMSFGGTLFFLLIS